MKLSFPKVLVAVSLLFLIGIAVCNSILYWRVRRATELNESRHPALRAFTQIQSDTNNAVQEAFAYVVSGEEAEKIEFVAWASSLNSKKKSFLNLPGAQFSKRSRANFLDVVEQQKEIHLRGIAMMERFDKSNRVHPSDFAEFESAVDRFSDKSEIFAASQRAELDRYQTTLRETLRTTDRMIIIIGLASATICFVLFFYLIRSFRRYDRQRDHDQRSLLESKRKFREIFETEPQCVKLLDESGRLLDMNPAGLSMIAAPSLDSVRGRPIVELVIERDRQLFLDACRDVFSGKNRFLKFEIQGIDGQRRQMESHLIPLQLSGDQIDSLLSITRDVTEQYQVEAELTELRERIAHVGRVNMMGEMASSIAHELNQPLSAVTNYSFALQAAAKMEDHEPAQTAEIAERISDQAMRAADIIRRLRKMVRNDSSYSNVDVNQAIDSMFQMIEPDLRQSKTRLTKQLESDLPLVWGDDIQIQQILLNLFRNAIDAMSEAPVADRILSVSTQVRSGMVEVLVADQGPGILLENTDAVFTAFFTTKAVGMGMGLAVSRSIAESHGGELTADPSTTRGALFRLALPVDQHNTSKKAG